MFLKKIYLSEDYSYIWKSNELIFIKSFHQRLTLSLANDKEESLFWLFVYFVSKNSGLVCGEDGFKVKGKLDESVVIAAKAVIR